MIDTVDNQSTKKLETEGSCQSMDKSSTDIYENTITKTKDKESIEEACKFVLNSACKICEVTTEVEQRKLFRGASSKKDGNLIEGVDNLDWDDVICENNPHTVLVTNSSKKTITCKVFTIYKF